MTAVSGYPTRVARHESGVGVMLAKNPKSAEVLCGRAPRQNLGM